MFPRIAINILLLNCCLVHVWGIGPWQQVNDSTIALSPGYLQASAFFPQTQEFLLFGGSNGTSINNNLISINYRTWKTNNTKLNTSPSMRSSPAYVSNIVSGDFYVQGGRAFNESTPHTSYTLKVADIFR
jgi:hypothetical protein